MFRNFKLVLISTRLSKNISFGNRFRRVPYFNENIFQDFEHLRYIVKMNKAQNFYAYKTGNPTSFYDLKNEQHLEFLQNKSAYSKGWESNFLA